MIRNSFAFPYLVVASLGLSACNSVNYSLVPLVDVGNAVPPPRSAEWKPYQPEKKTTVQVDPSWRSAAGSSVEVSKTALPPVNRVEPVDPTLQRQSVSERIKAVKSGNASPSANDGWTSIHPAPEQAYRSRPDRPKSVKVDIDQPWMVRNVDPAERTKVISTIKLAVDNGSSSYTDLSGKTFLAKSTGTPIDGPCKDVKVSVSATGETSTADFRYAQVCSTQ